MNSINKIIIKYCNLIKIGLIIIQILIVSLVLMDHETKNWCYLIVSVEGSRQCIMLAHLHIWPFSTWIDLAFLSDLYHNQSTLFYHSDWISLAVQKCFLSLSYSLVLWCWPCQVKCSNSYCYCSVGFNCKFLILSP